MLNWDDPLAELNKPNKPNQPIPEPVKVRPGMGLQTNEI